MKKYFAAALAVLTVAASCQKNAGQAVPEDLHEGLAPVPVQFGTNVKTLHTKAVGSIDAWSGNETLYIIGAERTAEGLVLDNLFIDNVAALSPSSTDPGTDGRSGAIEVKDSDGKYFYYVDDQPQPNYDFFGYYVDDAVDTSNGAPALTVADGKLSVDVEITGQQDLLVAVTNKTADCIAGDKDAASGEPKVSEARAYSAFAARRHVQPNLIFSHKLAQFAFALVSGNDNVASNVTIDGISVTSNTKATMQVAGDGAVSKAPLTNLSDPQALPLWVKNDAGTLVQVTPADSVTCPAYNADAEVVKALDGCIMVIPTEESEYALSLDIAQKVSADPEEWQSVTRNLVINFNDIQGSETGKKYPEEGYRYVVTIKVYGLENVSVNVSLEEWKSGGNIRVDTDME